MINFISDVTGAIKGALVNSEGGLTTAGYVLCIALALTALILAAHFSRKKSGKSLNIRGLVCQAVCLALAFVLSFVKIIPLPFGGSVTLCSMLFIVLVGYFYGTGAGLLTGFVYGMMQFLQGPYILSLFQVMCDYLLAFTCLGLGGLFCHKKNGLVIGYIVAILARGAFHSLGGYLYWMEYMPENFPTVIAWAYPVVYNYMYIIAEGIITVILICLPPVKSALKQIKTIAVGEK